MSEYLIVLSFAALPAISNCIGGTLAEVVPLSKRTLGLALHAAVGVLLAIVAVELMPRVTEAKPSWIAILAFFVGGGFYIVSDRLLNRVQRHLGDSSDRRTAWIIFFSISLDLFSDGLMIGTSVTISQHLGLLLALARVIAHIPEGFVTVAEFRQQKVPRRFRLPLLVSLIIPIVLGATLGYWLLREQPDIFKLGVLAFTTGILTTAIVEEIIPEAHETEDTPLSNLIFVGSFALFTLLSVIFEG